MNKINKIYPHERLCETVDVQFKLNSNLSKKGVHKIFLLCWPCNVALKQLLLYYRPPVKKINVSLDKYFSLKLLNSFQPRPTPASSGRTDRRSPRGHRPLQQDGAKWFSERLFWSPEQSSAGRHQLQRRRHETPLWLKSYSSYILPNTRREIHSDPQSRLFI